MRIRYDGYEARKRVPLTISYGTQSTSTNVCIVVEHEDVSGFGEATSYSVIDHEERDDRIARDAARLDDLLQEIAPWHRAEASDVLARAGVGTACRAAVDMALYDWLGRALRTPLGKLLGVPERAAPPTSVTIGISSPAAARARVRQWRELGAIRCFKVKLGSPDGLAADRAMFTAAFAEIGAGHKVSVDANGAWDLGAATEMSRWLAGFGVAHVEQPMLPSRDFDLATLHESSAIPIFVDESCRNAHDVARLAQAVDGINIKLMKCGGISEAMRMIHVAHAHDLEVMLGCYGDGMLSNAAALQLAPLADYVDLDSHLNQIGTPFKGLRFEDGYLLGSGEPGLGIAYGG